MPTSILQTSNTYDASGDAGSGRPSTIPIPERKQIVDKPINSSGGPDKRTKKLSEIKSRLLRPALTTLHMQIHTAAIC